MALLVFIPALLIILSVAFSMLKYHLESSAFEVKGLNVSNVKLAKSFVVQEIETVIKDLRFLSQGSIIEDVLSGDNDSSRTNLIENFLLFSKEKKMLDQIRLLDMDGKEVIRVNYNNGAPISIVREQLQDKSSRYYFKETLALQRGQHFISNFDLNIENGVIEKPYKPTLRFATLVYNRSGERIGVLILNYLGQKLLDTIRKLIPSSSGTPLLLNQDGYFLLGPSADKEWGFMFGKKAAFAFEYPQVFQYISSSSEGQINSKGYMFTFQKLENGNRWWTIISQVDANIEYLAIVRHHIGTLIIVIILIIITAIASWWFASSKLAQMLLLQSERKFTDFSETSSDWLWETDADMSIRNISSRMKDITGINIDRYLGKPLHELMSPDAEQIDVEHHLELLTSRTGFKKVPYKLKNFLGQILLFNVTAKPYFVEGIFSGYRGTCQDITNYKQLSIELQKRVLAAEIAETKSEQFAQKLAEAQSISHIGSWSLDRNRNELTCSAEIFRIYGIESNECNRSYQAFLETIYPDDRDKVKEEYKKSIKNGITFDVEHRIVRKTDGAIRWVHERCQHQCNEKGRVIRSDGTVQDITERIQAQKEIHRLAMTDQLTGLANRNRFYQQFEDHLKLAQREKKNLGLMLLDLDRFKAVNDRYGHPVGDALLQAIAAIFRKNTRETDTVARLGGDEFVILIVHHKDNKALEITAQRIIDDAQKNMIIKNHQIQTGVSIGIALFPDDADNKRELIHKADKALYEAKRLGRSKLCFYRPELEELAK